MMKSKSAMSFIMVALAAAVSGAGSAVGFMGTKPPRSRAKSRGGYSKGGCNYSSSSYTRSIDKKEPAYVAAEAKRQRKNSKRLHDHAECKAWNLCSLYKKASSSNPAPTEVALEA